MIEQKQSGMQSIAEVRRSCERYEQPCHSETAVCDFHRGKLGVVIAGIVYGIVCTEGVLLYPAEFPFGVRECASHSLERSLELWPLGQFLIYSRLITAIRGRTRILLP